MISATSYPYKVLHGTFLHERIMPTASLLDIYSQTGSTLHYRKIRILLASYFTIPNAEPANV